MRITPIQTACQNFVFWWFPCDFLISDNLAYQKCFVLERLLYSGFIFTVILLNVYWMNRWVFAQGFFFVWVHFNVFKGDTQTKTLKRVFAFLRRFLLFTSSLKSIENNYATFSYRHFLVCFQCIDMILDITVSLRNRTGEERRRQTPLWQAWQ